MKTYFFDTRIDGVAIRDEVGAEMRDDASAVREAEEGLRVFAAAYMQRGLPLPKMTSIVRASTGIVAEVSMRDALLRALEAV